MVEQDSEIEEEPKDWEGYSSYRSQLEKLRVDQVTTFDSSIVNLASGALGLSVVLLTALAATITPVHMWILFGAWIGFVLCIIANLISYQTGAKAAELEIAALDAEMRGESPALPWRCRKATLYLNRLVIFLFPLGTVFFLVFAAMNAAALGEQQISPAISHIPDQTNNETK